jgi:hypothetical protein
MEKEIRFPDYFCFVKRQSGQLFETAAGSSAMPAYARMQFTRMSELERNLANKAILRYCELDTLSMVMI